MTESRPGRIPVGDPIALRFDPETKHRLDEMAEGIGPRVITGVHLVADLSRMGGLAQHVAESVRRRYPNHVTSGEAEQLLGRMGRLAGGLAGLAEQVLRTHDPELATELDRRDDELDGLHRELLDLIQDPAWTDSVTVAVDVTLLGRFYERFGDHTVVVGRRVIFLVTGEPMAQ
ncbi:phosphate signaling complex PhoU family protein [Rhodococcus sp. NPDC019627]|uniref:phosphate signaling complex PhoU family protein n=1 Tax=unclassified Rhodococcus (in: high G+C Gram-positive bacteria) TaxID=192944 RepID=UPI0033CF430E